MNWVISVCGLLVAQAFAGSLTGVVRDPLGEVVKGAQVRLIGNPSGVPFEPAVKANESGRFVFSSIPPGVYDVEVRSPGFGMTRHWGAVRFTDIDVKLELPVVIFPSPMCDDGNFTKPYRVLALEGTPERGVLSCAVYP